MVYFAFIRQKAPSISFFFARLEAFLEFSGGHRPQVGLLLPRDCGAFRPVLTTLYPLIRHSLIAHHLEMAPMLGLANSRLIYLRVVNLWIKILRL